MKCPQCGDAEMEQRVKDVPYSWRGKKRFFSKSVRCIALSVAKW